VARRLGRPPVSPQRPVAGSGVFLSCSVRVWHGLVFCGGCCVGGEGSGVLALAFPWAGVLFPSRVLVSLSLVVAGVGVVRS
jgi:hypothetical protein